MISPGHIALVGAGNGKGAWAQWLVHQAGKSRVTLIEAEPLQYATLQRTLNSLGEPARHCEIRNALVGAQPGTASFFVTSSQQESGLLDPLSLLSLWPNLQTEESRELEAITVDTLLGSLEEDAEPSLGERHWLVIDCLPVGELLRASSKLGLVDVIIARVLLSELRSVPTGTSLEEVSELLQQNGMVQIAVEATRHPGIGYALFVRDARSALHAQMQKHHSERQKLHLNSEEQARLLQESRAKAEQLAQAKLIVEQQAQERALQLEQLSKRSDEQAKLAHEREVQIEQLTQAKAVAEKQSQERAQQLEQVGKARDEQAKLAQERLTQIEQLTQAKVAAEKQSQERAQQLEQLGKAREEQTKLTQERQAQIEQLTKAKSTVEKQSVDRALQLEQLGKARDEQAKLVQECQAQIEQLTLAKAAAEKQSQELALRLDRNWRSIEDRSQEINSQLVNFRNEVENIFSEKNKKIEFDNPLFDFIKKETRNITKQMEAYWRIQAVLNNQLSAPSMHGWPISADFAVLLIDTIKYENFDYIIEFGSGTSTFIICQALIKNNKINNTKFFSFEHLDKYFSATQSLLERISIGDAPVFLIKSPLVDYSDDNGDYKFYDVSRLLLDQKSIERPKVLVIVDGPPSSTGKNARYPALPIILEKFQGANISLILDDSDRDEEKEVVSIWRSYLNSKNFSFKEEKIQLEKGALLIKVNYEDAAL